MTTESPPRARLDGTGVQDVQIDRDGTHAVPVREGAVAIRLITGSGHVPGEERRLGAAVSRIAIDGAMLSLSDPRLATGWHGCEDGWRWTDGAALLLVAGARQIEARLAALPFATAA